MGRSNRLSKRPRIHCDDCKFIFTDSESLELHRQSYCIRRFRILPSSTVTDPMLSLPFVNDTTKLTSSMTYQSSVQELEEAMAVKRTLLETSIKVALDAQNVICYHKEVQQRTQRAFKDLDKALKKEKALTPEASPEERQRVFAARSQALLKAEAAYREEKNSTIVVEHALFKQKLAIEGTISATAREQTALIAALLQCRTEAEKRDMSLFHDTNFPIPTAFVRESKVNEPNETFLEGVMPPHMTANMAVGSTSVPEQMLCHDISRTLEARKVWDQSLLTNRLRQCASHLTNSEELKNFSAVASNVNASQSVMGNVLYRSHPHSVEGIHSRRSCDASTYLPYRKRYSAPHLNSLDVIDLTSVTSPISFIPRTEQLQVPHCTYQSNTVGFHIPPTYQNGRNLTSQILHQMPDVYLPAQSTDLPLTYTVVNSVSETYQKGLSNSCQQSKGIIHSNAVASHLNCDVRSGSSNLKAFPFDHTYPSEIMHLNSAYVDSRLTSQFNNQSKTAPSNHSNREELMNLTTSALDGGIFAQANENQLTKTCCFDSCNRELEYSSPFLSTVSRDESYPSETIDLTAAVSHVTDRDKKCENQMAKTYCSVSSSSEFVLGSQISQTVFGDSCYLSETLDLTVSKSHESDSAEKYENSEQKNDSSVNSNNDFEHTSFTHTQQKKLTVDDDYLLPDLVIDC